MDKIQPVNSISAFDIYKVLSSEKLTDNQKAEFLYKNSAAIKSVAESEITREEFKEIMANRPLIKFRPLKNSFTKQGDDIILAQALDINKKDINKYIDSVIEGNFEIHDRQDKDNIEKLKTYVYRHGTKDQVIAFLEYELSDVKFVLNKLYKTLDINTSGSMAEYFMRPIHRMDNITMGKLYRVIDKSLRDSREQGVISDEEFNMTAKWALVKIHDIQNNSKLIHAFDIYKDLTS